MFVSLKFRADFLNAVYLRRSLTCILGLTNNLIDGGQLRAKPRLRKVKPNHVLALGYTRVHVRPRLTLTAFKTSALSGFQTSGFQCRQISGCTSHKIVVLVLFHEISIHPLDPLETWGTRSKKISCCTLTLKPHMPTKDRKEDQRAKPGESRKNKENRPRLKIGYHQQVKAYTLQFSRFSSLNFPFWVNLASVPMQPAFEVFWVFFSLSSSFYFTLVIYIYIFLRGMVVELDK